MKISSFSRVLSTVLLMLFTSVAFSATSNAMDDTAITAKVKSTILMDKALSIFDVSVSTTDGVVSLSGKVDSDSQASSLIEKVQSIQGVQDVNASALKVEKSNQPFEDMLITSKIKGTFIREKLFGDKEISAMSIHVETNNGTVYLTGTADSQQQADNAASLAKSVKGVKTVESTVKITPANSTL